MIEIGTTDIAQFDPLEVIPDAFIRIEIRGIAGQLLQMQSLGSPAFQEGFDLLGAVDGRAVLNEQDRTGDLAQEDPQESDDRYGIVAYLANLHEQTSIQGDSTDG